MVMFIVRFVKGGFAFSEMLGKLPRYSLESMYRHVMVSGLTVFSFSSFIVELNVFGFAT